MPKVTTISVHYNEQLQCYQIAVEADNGASYLGRFYMSSLRDLLDFIAYEIKELESTELETGGDEIACN